MRAVERRHADRTLVLSLGDPAGIGPEIVLKAAEQWMARPGAAPVAIAAPAGLLRDLAAALGLKLTIGEGATAGPRPGSLTAVGWTACVDGRHTLEAALVGGAPALSSFDDLPRRPSTAGGLLSWHSLARSYDLVMEDPARRALVTAPVSKESLSMAGFAWPGHTEYLGWRCGVDDPLMWMSSPALSVGLVSNHDPVARLSRCVTPARTELKARLALVHLADRHAGQRLVVLALNPHGGDGGVLGGEEVEWMRPLLDSLRAEGLPVDGPLSADAALARGKGRFLAMYHDQGLPVFKLVAGSAGVNATLGLPLIRCAPDHGTAFDIAGRGVADPGSMLAAMEEALALMEDSRPR